MISSKLQGKTLCQSLWIKTYPLTLDSWQSSISYYYLIYDVCKIELGALVYVNGDWQRKYRQSSIWKRLHKVIQSHYYQHCTIHFSLPGHRHWQFFWWIQFLTQFLKKWKAHKILVELSSVVWGREIVNEQVSFFGKG